MQPSRMNEAGPVRVAYRPVRTPKQTGDAIRDARRALGVTQRSLAAATGMSRSHIARIEAGDHNITHQALQRILAALRYDIEFHPRPERPSWMRRDRES